MGMLAAKQGDTIQAQDTHIVIEIATGVPNQVVLPFLGVLSAELSPNVRIAGRAAALVGSVAINYPPHVAPPGTSFKSPPLNRGKILSGSPTVRINSRPAARLGDVALTCNDPTDLPIGRVQAEGTVSIG